MAKVFGGKVGSKVDSAIKQTNSALGLFAKAIVKIAKANEILIKTENDALEEARVLIEEANRAKTEREANELVQSKLKDFIPQIG